MEFKELSSAALEVRKKYEALETKLYGRSWDTKEIALGFVGDVGDLSKLVLANEGMRQIDGHKEKLAHELSDCLWSILVLADQFDVDLEKEFLKTMNELKLHISSKENT